MHFTICYPSKEKDWHLWEQDFVSFTSVSFLAPNMVLCTLDIQKCDWSHEYWSFCARVRCWGNAPEGNWDYTTQGGPGRWARGRSEWERWFCACTCLVRGSRGSCLGGGHPGLSSSRSWARTTSDAALSAAPSAWWASTSLAHCHCHHLPGVCRRRLGCSLSRARYCHGEDAASGILTLKNGKLLGFLFRHWKDSWESSPGVTRRPASLVTEDVSKCCDRNGLLYSYPTWQENGYKGRHFI